MTPDRIRQLSPGFAVALTTLLFVGCSSGGGGTPQATVQGAVVDGYVRGATVTLYGTEGFAGPAALATATTDANGDFVLTLPEAELPDYFALLSKGGTIIDTGMPAPTMAMMAMRERDRYYVTPLTDRVTRQGMRGGGFVTAENALSAELELTPAELYDDPLAADGPAKAKLTAGLYRSLAAGDQTVALPDGAYLVRLVFFDKKDIDIGTNTFTDIDDLLSAKMLDGTLNIANGVVTGTIDTDTVTGRIQGPSLVLSLEYPDGVVRVAGTVGLLGSLSGTYVDFDDGLPDDQKLSSGVFVASLIPASGIESEGLKTVTEELYAGERNLLFRDIYGDRDLGWGAMGAVSAVSAVSLNADAGTITAPEFDVTLNAAASVSDTLSFVEGKLVTLDDGTPAGLAVMHFTDSGGDHYLIQALGNRRGVYVAGASDGNIYAIGESYLARSDALGVDLLTENEGEEMQLAVSNVSVHMLGSPRDPDAFVDTKFSFTVPVLDAAGTGADGDATDEGVQVVSGSMLGLKSSAGGDDPNAIDDDDDFLAIAELHPTGALQGDIMDGGSFAGLGPEIDAADWPVPLVGFAAPTDTDPSLVDTGEAQLDFIARPLYTIDPDSLYTIDPDSSALISLVDYKLAVISGTIRSQDDRATLTYRDNEGETGTLALTVENHGGVYHLHGSMGAEYIDILWGAGGTRAVFVSSTQADGKGEIYEIGEAFLSY